MSMTKLAKYFSRKILAILMACAFCTPIFGAQAAEKSLVYLSAGIEAPFWRYVAKGAEAAAQEKGYDLTILDSRNNAQSQLQNALL